MIAALLSAIHVQYDSTTGATLRTATPGGMWLSQAPQSSAGIYIVVVPISDTPTFAMPAGTATIYDVGIQFSVCDPTAISGINVVSAKTALVALYNDQLLAMTGYRMLLAKKGQGLLLRDPDSEGISFAQEFKFIVGE